MIIEDYKYIIEINYNEDLNYYECYGFLKFHDRPYITNIRTDSEERALKILKKQLKEVEDYCYKSRD
tara:strand:+ start:238 stop:438 length:201 start_codon:yes stop_codon:yes gene_type:complete